MEKAARVMALMAAGALAVACGGSPGPADPTAVSPSTVSITPPKAHITVTLGLDTVVGPSLDPAYAEYVRFTSFMSESAGLGANLNYIRGEFYRSGALVESYQVNAADLVGQTGSSRLEARSSRILTVTLRRNEGCDLIRTTFQFTDDKGNDHHIVGNLGPGATLTPASREGEGAARL